MRRCYLSKPLVLVAVLLGLCSGAFAQTVTFSTPTTAAPSTYTVPPNVTAVRIDAIGANGGQGGLSSYGSRGGYGGRVTCNLAVTAGQLLYVYVGGAGTTGYGVCCPGAMAGGANGGGAGYYGYAGGGGGGTDVSTTAGPFLTRNRVVVAGGGGGGGYNCTGSDPQRGGDGGGLTGGNGLYCGNYNASYSGTGGSQTAGGAAGSAYSQPTGTGGLGTGGSMTSGYYGGGGGGGYYGGGSAGSYAGGGGGSSYTDPVLATNVTLTSAFNDPANAGSVSTGNGKVTICALPAVGSVVAGASLCTGSTTTLTITGPATGGTWASSNAGLAVINPATGVLTAQNPGGVTISYTASNSCGTVIVPVVMTVYTSPSPITGNINVCPGTTTTLTDAGGGTWSSSNTAMATVNPTTGIVSGVSAGSPIITYTLPLPNGCTAMTPVSVNPPPTQYAVSISNAGFYCSGGTGVSVGVAGSNVGLKYRLMNASGAVDSFNGNGAGQVFPRSQTAAGTYTVVATNLASGCVNSMANTVAVSINPLPTLRNVTVSNGGSYCAGGIGVSVGLDTGDINIRYQLYNGSLTAGSGPMMGSGGTLNFGLMTAAGVYTVTATNTITGCTSNMTGSANVTPTPLPAVYTVTGGGSYCVGSTGKDIFVNGSNNGIDYLLYNGGVLPVRTVAGGAGPIVTFSGMTAGNYSVVAKDHITGCTSNMAGTVLVATIPLPAFHNLTGDGRVTSAASYCTGGAGVHIGLDFSNTGVSYQLSNTSGPIGTAITGTGSAIDFGTQPVGTYSVKATNIVAGCNANMPGNLAVTFYTPPTKFNVSTTGSGSYCVGSPAPHIIMNNSTTNVSYQLYKNGVATGSPFHGTTGTPIDFGAQSDHGNYTVIGTSLVSFCSETMLGTGTITELPVPYPYTVSGGGNYCVGQNGTHVYLSASDAGIDYTLYQNGVATPLTYTNTGALIDFNVWPAGVYSVTARNTATGCTSNMAGNVTVSLNPPPTVYNVSSVGTGAYCTGEPGAPVHLAFSNAGVNYYIYSGSALIDSMPGIGAPLDFGLHTQGTYTVSATNPTTGCTNNMSGAAVIIENPLPFQQNVSGTGTYCSGGSGLHIYLDASNVGTRYQLFNGSLSTGGLFNGTGTRVDFGSQVVAGTYFVQATNVATGCKTMMNTSASIGIDPLPVAYSVIGGGAFCAGTSGALVGLDGSDNSDISYQLYNGSAMVGSSVSGTTAAFDFGTYSNVGNYTVIATNNLTHCTNAMYGNAVISINPLPNAFTVSGGGSYCTGGTGYHITLNGSNPGVSYELNNGSLVSTLTGVGSALDFGVISAAGNYQVIATNTTTNCSRTMNGSANITINSLPASYIVSAAGTGHYCSGGTGVDVSLAQSDPGVRYQLYFGASPIGLPKTDNTSSAIDFGNKTAAGTYTVKATNIATSCSSTMTGSAVIAIDPVVIPSIDIASSINPVCEGTSVEYTVPSMTNGGSAPSFQWTVNGSAVGADTAYFTYTPANGDVVNVKMISNANCLMNPSAENAVTMVVNPVKTPTVSVTINKPNTVCSGTQVLYNAIPYYGGNAAQYKWMKGVNQVGANVNYYETIPVEGDNIYCVMTSSYECITVGADTTVMSNHEVMHIDVPLQPTVTVTASPSKRVKIGTDVTYTANVTNGGAVPTYQWQVNGKDVPGATGPTFSRFAFNNRDSITCVALSSGNCDGNYGNGSLTVTAYDATGVNEIASGNNVKVFPNPNKGTFTIKGSLTSTATEEVTVEIANMLGQVVYNAKIVAQNGDINESVALNTLANGVYIVTLRSGSETSVIHMVVGQ